MMSANIRSVKVYTKDGEIRRFSTDSIGQLTYDSVKQKVGQLFDEQKVVKLAWKDTDGDTIIINNEEEFTEAMRNSSGDVLHLYVLPDDCHDQSRDTTPKQGSQQHRHDGQDKAGNITCHNCGTGITGLRYKCLTCPDYDLCDHCEAQRIHDVHPMIRITSPNDTTWRPAFFASQFVNVNGRDMVPGCNFNFHENKGANAESCAGNAAPFRGLIESALQAFGIVPNAQNAGGASEKSSDTEKEKEEKIRKAVDQMVAMGFSDEDGWLTTLLHQTNGNILAVLDLIKPTGK